ncbi:GumC family protein [Calditrichota bacterium GD2]
METRVPGNFETDMWEGEEQPLHLTDYIRILYRGRWLIILSFIAVFSATVLYTFSTDPTYEASAVLLVESNDSMDRALFNLTTFGTQTNLLNNQIEILKSRNIAERVVKRLEKSAYRDSISFFKKLEDGSDLTFNQRVAIVMSSLEVEPRRDTDIITLTYQAGSPFEAAFLANVISEEFAKLNAETNRMEVSEMRKFIEDRLAIKAKELKESEEALKKFQEREKIASLDAETQELVTRLSETESYLEQARIELNSKLQLKKNLEEKLNERKETLPENLSEISTPYIQTLQQELARVVAERTSYVTALETQVQSKREFFTPELVRYDERIKALKKKIREEAAKIANSEMISDPLRISQDLVNQLINLSGEITATEAKIAALEDVLKVYNQRLENLPDKVLQLVRLERRKQVDEQTYMMLTQKLEEAKIQESAQARNVKIIDRAIKPNRPVKPNKRMNLMLGAILGLGLGVGITFMIEYLDRSVRKPEDMERMGYNVLATIPKIELDKVEKSKIKQNESAKIEARLITHIDPKSPVSEAYRTLRTNLQFSKIEKDLKTILVTSAGPKEGKSTTAANLSIALAQAGNRVVIVDADLRRPILHSVFGTTKEEGLTNHLAGSISYEQAFKETVVENLSLVTSGVLPPNPSELLASKKMEDFLNKLCEDFDIVVLDSPPVIAVTDASILSTKVDGTLLVVYAGQTERDAIKRAANMLNSVSARLLGIVLNGFDVQGIYGSYYYYYYHHYYGGEGKSKPKRKFI